MVLEKLPEGAGFSVVRVNLGREVGRRLADMGFIEGVRGSIIRKKFWGGPLVIRIMGYEILLRRSEAAGIEVKAGPETVLESAVESAADRA
ncbi:MAG: ferrous iron transport protein A [Treponema sp.]|jgi:Fe2+ transport system protein FeoA|nr:ferrous iron transport protein A [Treponema sp.]